MCVCVIYLTVLFVCSLLLFQKRVEFGTAEARHTNWAFLSRVDKGKCLSDTCTFHMKEKRELNEQTLPKGFHMIIKQINF